MPGTAQRLRRERLRSRQSTSERAYADLSKARASRATSYSDTGLGRLGFLCLGEPRLAPLQRGFLRQDAGRRVVHVPLADTAGAELGKNVVKALAAEVEGFRVGPVAEPEHAVADLRQVGPGGLQVLVKGSRVVGHVALAVRRGANQKDRLLLKNRRIQAVHHDGLDLGFAVIERE